MDHNEIHCVTDEESESEVEVEEKSKREKKRDSPTPFLTAYNLYSNSVRSSVIEANPGAEFGDIVRVITKQFKLLHKDERAKWNELARQDKERYYSEMENCDAPSDDDSEEASRS